MEAFADYAMDASGTTEESMMLRMAKNAVSFDASAGAYDGDRMVGFTLIGLDELGGELTAFDAGTGIVPDFRGRGLAKAMFDHALPELRNQGVQRFLLEVLQQNEPAIKAYEKSGFEIIRELKCFAVETASLRSLDAEPDTEIRPIAVETFRTLVSEADWVPSFENRFTVHAAIPSHVTTLGAFDGETCVGVVTYCRDLNWLLSLLVVREHRRRGIGRTLLRALAARIPENRSRLAALNIDASDVGMQAFLSTVGFSPLVDQYEMQRRL